MEKWTLDAPEQLTFGPVESLDVRIVAGRLAVLASEGPPTLELTEIESAAPLLVSYDALTKELVVTYEGLTLDGLLGWLRRDKRRTNLTLTVPRGCRVNTEVVSASTVLAGFERSTRVKSVSSEVVLDGVSGEVSATTVSGSIESRAMEGDLALKTVSGELTLADGSPRRLKASTVSGRITADLTLRPTSHVTLNSVSGAILVRVPENVESDVSMRSTSGRLSSTFDGLSANNSPGSKTLSGRLGGGMASLSAYTVSGEVALLKGEKE
ncbi:DUF4097 family beta strand repeat-containing protein [Actinomadura sp. ATCC 39365]|uniref:DUF4097 family beta strand repeat-containing protein n=1 Tax=Nonomuraea sp. NPDC005692 TaxID=3157168 RepID=UPI00340B0E5B